MDKKKKIIVLLLLLILLYPTYLNNIKAEENGEESKVIGGPEIGSLRCKPETLNKGCVEYKDSNGIVSRVEITLKSSNNDIDVVKVVEKTDILGQYKVYFKTKGIGTSTITTYSKADIIILLDYSSSFSSYKSSAISAISSFAKRIAKKNNAKERNYRIAYAKFSEMRHENSNATKVVLGWRKDDKQPSWGSLGVHSAIQEGLDVVYSELLTKTRKDAKKYVIVVSDGRFWPDGSYAQRKNYNKYVTISYDGCSEEHKNKGYGPVMEDIAKNIRNYSTKKNKKTYKTYVYGVLYGNAGCMEKGDMLTINGNSTKRLEIVSKKNSFDAIFKSIEKSIDTGIVSEVKVSVKIIDDIGVAFSEYSGQQEEFEVSNLTSNYKSTDSILIKIDPSSDTGWYNTNEGFQVTYSANKNTSTINSNINPEVYWEKQIPKLEACSDEVNLNKEFVTVNRGQNNYYKITCNSGYINNNVTYNGFNLKLITNNLGFGKKSFDASKGFPINLKLTDNIKCIYEFNKDNFNEDYNYLTSKIDSTTGNDQVEYIKERYNLVSKIGEYKNLSNINSDTNGLKNYAKNISNKSAKLFLNYNDLDIIEEISLHNSDVDSKIYCDNNTIKTEDVYGNSVEVFKECYLNISKKMNTDNTCINISTGENETCSEDNSSKQLFGGNNIYTSYDKDGTFSLLYEDVTYDNSLSIKLDGDNCKFTNNGNNNVLYRQIDVNDPFVQNNLFNSITKRNIGSNWNNSNGKYNFTNIIEKDIWNSSKHEPEFIFMMSKMNIENIRKNTLTSESKVNSYIGSDCNISADSSKYVCNFIRDTDNQFFVSK